MSHAVHETAGPQRVDQISRSRSTAAPGVSPSGIAATLLGLQRTVGNVAVSRLLGPAMIQRQGTAAPAAPAPPAGGAATVGKVGGKRPAVKTVMKKFDDCSEAVDWLNSGAWTGDAQPVYKPTAGKIRRTKLPDGTVKAEVDLTWAYDASSTAEMTIPTWPEMTADEKAAVAKYKAALKAHEEMHFDVTDAVIKALPKTVSAIGSDNADAVSNLQTEVTKYGSDAQTAIDTATADYDTKTKNGKSQSAVGGDDVRLDCP